MKFGAFSLPFTLSKDLKTHLGRTHFLYPKPTSPATINMTKGDIPSEPPPSYGEVTGSSSSRPNAGSHLNVKGASSSHSIDPAHRRSMEDEGRPLPKGWVRSLDPEHHHQFFVDTTKDPPRSIWHHPYDDEEYLSTLPGEERERIEQESMGRGHPPSKHDIIAHDTDEEDDGHVAGSSSGAHGQELPPRPEGKKSFGRKLKDKVTGMTHEERVTERKKREENERRLYEQHQKIRQAMAKAAQTGEPQLIGKDKDGKDLFIEPPAYQGGGYGGGGYGYSPYNSTHTDDFSKHLTCTLTLFTP